jgi:hypothetical protein
VPDGNTICTQERPCSDKYLCAPESCAFWLCHDFGPDLKIGSLPKDVKEPRFVEPRFSFEKTTPYFVLSSSVAVWIHTFAIDMETVSRIQSRIWMIRPCFRIPPVHSDRGLTVARWPQTLRISSIRGQCFLKTPSPLHPHILTDSTLICGRPLLVSRSTDFPNVYIVHWSNPSFGSIYVLQFVKHNVSRAHPIGEALLILMWCPVRIRCEERQSAKQTTTIPVPAVVSEITQTTAANG